MKYEITGAHTRRNSSTSFSQRAINSMAAQMARPALLPTLELRRLVAAMVD